MVKRDSSCPLCGARMEPERWLEAGEFLIQETLGVVSAHCPYCQGAVELRPVEGRLELGYCLEGDTPRFEVVLTFPCEGLQVERSADGQYLSVITQDGSWEFIPE